MSDSDAKYTDAQSEREATPRFLGLSRVEWLWMVVSAVVYTLCFGWRFAIIVLGSLLIHEHGHLWAARKCGLRTGGITMIPFIGGVASITDEFRSRAAEVYIALMGPIWGFGTAVAMAIGYWLTHEQFFAAGTVLICLINIFNMLPINPLDGGRVMKSIAFSIGRFPGLLLLIASLTVTAVAAFYSRVPAFVLVLLLGAFELHHEFNATETTRRMNVLQVLTSVAAYLVVVTALIWLLVTVGHAFKDPGAALDYLSRRP